MKQLLFFILLVGCSSIQDASNGSSDPPNNIEAVRPCDQPWLENLARHDLFYTNNYPKEKITPQANGNFQIVDIKTTDKIRIYTNNYQFIKSINSNEAFYVSSGVTVTLDADGTRTFTDMTPASLRLEIYDTPNHHADDFLEGIQFYYTNFSPHYPKNSPQIEGYPTDLVLYRAEPSTFKPGQSQNSSQEELNRLWLANLAKHDLFYQHCHSSTAVIVYKKTTPEPNGNFKTVTEMPNATLTYEFEFVEAINVHKALYKEKFIYKDKATGNITSTRNYDSTLEFFRTTGQTGFLETVYKRSKELSPFSSTADNLIVEPHLYRIKMKP